MPQCLKEAGYKTAIIGKWHLGHADKKYWPKQRGFDYQYGAMIGELDYFTHERARRARLVPRQRAGQGGRLHDHAPRQRRREAHRRSTTPRRRSISTSPSTPRTRRTRRRRSTSTATRTSQTPRAATYAGMVAAWTTRSAASSPRSTRRRCATTRSSSSTATTAARATRCSPASWPTCPRSRSPATTARTATARARSTKAATRVCRLANWPGHIKPGDGRRHHPRRGHLPDARRAGRRVHRQVQAARRRERLGHHREGQALAAHGDRLQHRAVPRRDPAGRLEAHLADAAALERRSLQPPAGTRPRRTTSPPQHPDKVAALQQRLDALAKESAKPLFLVDQFKVVMKNMNGEPVLPIDDDFAGVEEP